MKPSLRLFLPATAALLALLASWQLLSPPSPQTAPEAEPRATGGTAGPVRLSKPSLAPSGPTAPAAMNFFLASPSPASAVIPPPGALPVLVPTKADAARTSPRDHAPLPADFPEKILNAARDRVQFTLPDGTTVSGPVQMLTTDEAGVRSVQGPLDSPAAGSYYFARQPSPGAAGALAGHVLFAEGALAWRVDPTGPDGSPELNAVSRGQVVCFALPAPDPESAAAGATPPPEPDNSPQYAPQTHPTSIGIPTSQNGIIPLQSLPGAPGVIYLDFDGEPGPFEGWSSVKGDALPAGVSTSQIKEIWQRVAEDYQPFNLNITTDRGIFDKAAENRRQHVIITPTKDAAPSAGGVAFLRSFNTAGNTVCWAFLTSGKGAAEAISHEVGHTLGLSHDGRNSPAEAYYGGHGSGDTGWAPLMGVGYYQNLTQWSRGEYGSADNNEDDLNIIVSNNNSVDYRADDTGSTLATASWLNLLTNYTVSSEGIIETRADVDAWRFQTDGGSLSLTVAAVSAGPNMDLLAELVDRTNTVRASANPSTTLGATVSATLPAGDYFLRVSGVGKGSPATDGYSDYASLGAYLISGTIGNGVRPDRFSLNENPPAGLLIGRVTLREDHGSNDLSYSLVSGNTAGAFALNPATGVLTVAAPGVLNYETLSTRWDVPARFELEIAVTDAVDPALSENRRVVIEINNVNEPPVLTGGSATLFTGTRAGTEILAVTGSDPDRFDFPVFSILSGNTGNAFAINSSTGVLSVGAGLPTALPTGPFSLVIRGRDQGSPALTGDATVAVTLLQAPAGYAPGALMRTFFEGISGNTLSALTGNSRFPNTPDSEELMPLFDGGTHGDNYGSTARGWLIPPLTGSYTFWIASDDASDLRISTSAAAASATVRASVSSATRRYEYTRSSSQKSAALTLTAGQPYYIEARHKEGGGGDHLSVAWQGPGFARQTIPGRYLAPLIQNYAPRLAAQSFSIRRDADPGASPGIVAVTDINPGDSPSAFAITGGTAAPWCGIDAVTGRLFITDAAALAGFASASATLAVRVTELTAPPLSATGTVTLNLAAPSAILPVKGIVQQIWTGISGNNVSALTANSLYPASPTTTRILTDFDSGGNYAENYGSRIRAFVTPVVSGSYNFYIAGDDESQLRYTAGTNYSTAPQIAIASNATGRDNWTASSAQKSATLSLTAGRKYYLEVRHKEGGGGDFVQVAWTGPGITSPTVIPGSVLTPFDTNTAPSFVASPYNFTIPQGAPAGTLIGTVTATDPDGSRRVFSIASGNSAGAFAINPLNGTLTIADSSKLVPGSSALVLRVQDDGAEGAYPLLAASTTAIVSVTPDFTLIRPATGTANLPVGAGLELETLPSGRLGGTVAWTQLSGPGAAVFDDPAAWQTGVTFPIPGTWLIRGTETAGGLPLTHTILVQHGISSPLPSGSPVGTHSATPSHSWDNAVWQITSGGNGLPLTAADSFHFLSQPAASGTTITARISAVPASGGSEAIAGVMLRESAAADARYAFCGVTSRGVSRFLIRSTAGLTASEAASEVSPGGSVVPMWVRLIRSDQACSAWTAPDNSGFPGEFTPLGATWSIPLGGRPLIGLAASSAAGATLTTATIDNLTITSPLVNSAPDLTASATLTSVFEAGVSGSFSDDSLPSPPGLTVTRWQSRAGPGAVTFANPLSLDTIAGFGSPGVYKVRFIADDGEVRTFRDVSLALTETPADYWRRTRFGPDAGNPQISGDFADPDKDGLVNLIEYALSLNPLKPGDAGLNAAPVTLSGLTYLRLEIPRNPDAHDAQYLVETSTDPTAPESWNTLGLVIETDSPELLRVRTADPVGASPARFLRLRVFR